MFAYLVVTLIVGAALAFGASRGRSPECDAHLDPLLMTVRFSGGISSSVAIAHESERKEGDHNAIVWPPLRSVQSESKSALRSDQ